MSGSSMITFILAIICLLYGLLVSTIGSGTRFFIVWIMLGIFFFLLTYGISIDLWKKIPFILRILMGVCFIAVMASFIFVEGNIIRHFYDKGEARLDYIIVLGAQVYDDDPSPVLKYRLDQAYHYLIENMDTMCIVTGGQGYNETREEARVMKGYLIKRGIDEDRIILENSSKNTIQNIRNSMNVCHLSGKKIGIVTNNFHVYRGVQLARRQGLHACGIAARANPVFLVNNMLREFLGVCKDILYGNMSL